MSSSVTPIVTKKTEPAEEPRLAEIAFLLGSAFAIIKRVRSGETGAKIDHAMDRFLRDVRRYHHRNHKTSR